MTVSIEKVTRLRDAQFAICRVTDCMAVDGLNEWWGINKSKWMHETGIGRTDSRHKVDYWRLAWPS